MASEPTVLRVLICRDGRQLVAQCLERNIAIQGRTMPDLKRAFGRALCAHLHYSHEKGLSPLEHLEPAPQWLQERWDTSDRFADLLDLPDACESGRRSTARWAKQKGE